MDPESDKTDDHPHHEWNKKALRQNPEGEINGISEDPKKKKTKVRSLGKIMENPNSGFQVDEFKVVKIPERTNIWVSDKIRYDQSSIERVVGLPLLQNR